MKIYILNDVAKPSELRSTVASEIRKNAHVSDPKDAGVTDPCWVPGWKPGDSPTQDPICARSIKLLKDDISTLKRDMELMATKMQLEEEVGKLRRKSSRNNSWSYLTL